MKLEPIAINYSIYAHSSRLFDVFNSISSDYYKHLPATYNIQIHSASDQMISHFNYWVQLIDCDEMRVPKIEVLLIHSLSIELNTFVKEHNLIELFKQRYRTNNELYILSYFISREFLTVIEQQIETEYIKALRCELIQRPFYELTNAVLDIEGFQTFSIIHKDLFYKFKSDKTFKKLLDDTVRHSINETINFFHHHSQLTISEKINLNE